MKVSIITPTYNQAAFLEETLKSVLDQDYEHIEYIVLDDGSSDNTEEILACYGHRLKYVRHPNMGESRTVNKGYSLCSGDIVGVINSDDPLYTSNAVTLIVNAFEKNPDALAVYPDWVSIDKFGNLIKKYEQPQYTIHNMLSEYNVTLGPGMFIKRAALEKYGYRNEQLRYTGDVDLSFRLALAGKLIHVSKFLATHRVHPSAASSIAKGQVMASEVIRVVEFSLQSPLIPKDIARTRREIMANAYFSASKFCGNNIKLKWIYIVRAIVKGPDVITSRLINKISRQIKAITKLVLSHD